MRRDSVRHHRHVVQIDLAALPDDPDVLQQMLREVVPELQAENEKLWQLIQRLLRHRYGPRSERFCRKAVRPVLLGYDRNRSGNGALHGGRIQGQSF